MANLRPKVLNANGYDELLDDGDTIQLVAAPTADDHATNRLYVDTTVTTAVDAEEAARIAADAVLQGNIDAEASTRADEDSNLQDQINAITGNTPGTNPYVLRTGDDMSGNLTLGTDKITLDATAGSITADGSVTSEYLHVIANPAQTTGALVRIDGGVDRCIELMYDGSINAVGNITATGSIEAASIDGGSY